MAKKLFKELKNAFNDIRMPFGQENPLQPNLQPGYYNRPQGGGETQLDHVKHIQVGEGNNTFKADKQGWWMGSQLFTGAPIRATMNGAILMNDQQNDRVIIGYQKDGF